jgi:aspartate kinase
VVVVSAMGGTTDALTKMAHEITPNPQRRELDMLLTAGERETMALVSLAIMHEGLEAVSFTGSQVGIITDRFHSDARIEEIRCDRLRRALRGRVIPIVAGFQGVSPEHEVTTLGRGGSDVTAVALAAVLGADRCELYKDVDGVHTENPSEFPGVRLVPRLSFEELAELAGSGSEVIHPRACALAAKYRVQLSIRSSFNDKRGTTVAKLEKMEKAFVRAMTHNHKLVRLSLVDVPKKKQCLHQVVTQLAAARVPIVFFNHGVVHGDRFDLSFIIPEAHLAPAKTILARLAKQVRAVKLETKEDLCSVSVVGPGVGSDPEIMSGTLETLHRVGVHLDAFSTSETRLSCFMDRKDLRLAAAALLARFRLKR